MGGGNRAAAQKVTTDVTNTYLDNADFSKSTPVTVHVCGYKKDISSNKLNGQDAVYWEQDVTNWTKSGNKDDKNGGTGGLGGAVFAYGSEPQLKGGGVAAPNTNPSGEATGKALGFFAVWGAEIQYKQNAKTSLPAGRYDLTYTYYATYTGKTYHEVTNHIGFVEGNKTTHYGSTKTFKTGSWVTETVSFDLTDETSGYFSIGYKAKGGNNNGSGANPMLFVDNLKLTYTVIKDELKAAIDRATATNKVINNSELTTAITTAQGVYDNASVLQAAVDEATTTLVNAIDTAVKAALDAGLSDGDVTAIFLANYNFETAPITFTDGAKNSEAVRIGSNNNKDGWVYTIPGWTNASVVNNNAVQIATATYGGTYSVNSQGLNSTNPPSADNEGNAGAGLHMSAGHGDDAILTQQSLYTLPAGTYELTYNVYNANSKTGIAENFTGVSIDGTATYGSKLLATQDKWESDAVTFTLKEAKVVTFSLGFTTSTSGSGNGAKLYVDNLKLTYSSSTVDKTALQTAIDNATTANATLNNSDLTTAIATAQAVYDNASATQDDVDQAVTTLNAAVTTAKIAANAATVKNAAYNNGIATSFVTNGTFEDKTSDGWESTTEATNQKTKSENKGNTTNFWENRNADNYQGKMYQTVENIPNGTYKLSIDAFVETLGDAGTQYVYANDNKTNVTATTFTTYEVWTVVTSNKAEIGLEQTEKNNRWMGIDNVVLTYYGEGDVVDNAKNYIAKTAYQAALTEAKTAIDNNDYKNVTGDERTKLRAAINEAEPTTTDGYNTATDNLTTLTQTFMDAKEAYDKYADEKAVADKLSASADAPTTADGVETALQNLNVAEYNAIETSYTKTIALGAWTESGDISTISGQHWKDNTTTYYNQKDGSNSGYNASSWSMGLTQTIKLPAGDYVLEATGRKNSGATLTMSVTDGDNTELGTASTFPNSNSARGVTTEGKASFDENDTFNNDGKEGKGYGWQWRYVPFTLSAETEVTIAMNASANAKGCWASISDFTLKAKPSTEVSTLLYGQAYANAQAALNDETYNNINSNATERTALAAYPSTPTKTTETEIDDETTALTTATTAFTAAKDSYDAFVTAQGLATADLNLPYATAEKKTAFTTARNAEPTTATDAKTDAATLTTALRAYYESNAKAEGKTGAEAVTITNPSGGSESSNLDGWTTAVMRINHDEPYTTSDNTAHDYYFDANDDFWRSNATTSASMRQDVTLPSSGTYLLSVMSRSCETISSFKLFAGDNSTEMGHNGSSGQVFGNGWNSHYLVFTAPAGAISIGVEGTTPANTQGNWFSCDNFQLYRIGDLDAVTLHETSTEGPTTSNDYVDMTYERTLYTGWNSLVLPFDLDVSTLGSNTGSSESDGSESNSSTMQVITYDGTDSNDDGSVTFKFSTCTTTLAAGTPCMVYNNGGSDLTQSLTGTCRFTHNTDMSPKTTDDNASGYDFTGTYKAYDKNATDNPITLGDYYVNAKGLKAAKGGNKLNAFRAFFKHKGTDSTQAAKVNFVIDGNDVTGIKAVELEHAVLGDGAAYNLAGQKVNGSYKGLVIKNGKKIINK